MSHRESNASEFGNKSKLTGFSYSTTDLGDMFSSRKTLVGKQEKKKCQWKFSVCKIFSAFQQLINELIKKREKIISFSLYKMCIDLLLAHMAPLSHISLF